MTIDESIERAERVVLAADKLDEIADDMRALVASRASWGECTGYYTDIIEAALCCYDLDDCYELEKVLTGVMTSAAEERGETFKHETIKEYLETLDEN